MNKDQSSFFSDLLQNLGFLATAIVAITQYSLSSSFQFLFGENVQLLKISSLVALISSIAVFLGIFAFRFNLLNKIYISKKAKDRYQVLLSKQAKDQSIGKIQQFIPEPFGFTLLQMAFVFIALGIVSFSIALSIRQDVVTSISYIVFVNFIIAALSIFSIQLYREREIVKKRNDSNELILNKIREYFIGDIQIIYDSTEPFQFNGPNRQIIFVYKDKKYDVFTKSYDPENYFLLAEHKDPPNTV